MNLLLDTHLLLRAAGTPERLSDEAVGYIEEPGNRLLFSAASIWEVAIKNGLERTGFHADPALLRRGLLDNGYAELPITGVHASLAGQLPAIHKDPFDRILIAQAESEGLLLLTSDEVVTQYTGPIQRV